jgi:DNA-binding PadR family transcriptional regulator
MTESMEPGPVDDAARMAAAAAGAARFELAPPRRFVLPAILLLLSEQPGYGYSLEKELREFQFGRIDRPTVYRTLAQLESDGLVRSWAEAATAGQARRVYGVTALGERVLRTWMSVIKDERDCLGRVLRRYQATGTVDAVLAEVEGGWSAALGPGWSAVATTGPQRRLAPIDGDRPSPSGVGAMLDDGVDPAAAVGTGTASDDDPARRRAHDEPGPPTRFRLVPERSVVLIEVRSTVGPISFGALGVSGWVEAAVSACAIHAQTRPAAHIEIAMDGLRSGNSVYDAELLRRISARRYPTAALDLRDCVPSGPGNRFRLTGELTFHGVTRPIEGTVHVEVMSDRRLVVTGEQVFDIRDFDVPSPTVLMLRIYPDVRVKLQVEAEEDMEDIGPDFAPAPGEQG